MGTSPNEAPTILAGKYRLEEQIGTGGMGSVWQAQHVVLNRAVAVKLVEMRGGDPMLAERFLREARVAAAVRHPNVVDIIDFGQTESGQPFMVMELLEGESLLHRMVDDRPPLSTPEVVHIVAQVLMGLDAVHRAGIIHRDLKPGNIFLTPDEDGGIFARLLDFGISYSIDPESKLRRGAHGTDERLVMGTPEYMSPEQAEGRPDVDVRSDVYAVGVILYELLSNGELPYADPNPGGVLFKIMTGVHTPLSALRPDLPELCGVVEAALAHDREKRPKSARDLRRQLLTAAGMGADVSGMHYRLDRTSQTDVSRATPRHSESPTLEHVTPAPRPAPRPRWPLAVAALAAVLILGGAVWWLMPTTTTPAVASPVVPVAPPPVSAPVTATPPTAPEPAVPEVVAPTGTETTVTPTAEGDARRRRREARTEESSGTEPSGTATSSAGPSSTSSTGPSPGTSPEPRPEPRAHEIVRELDF